MRKELDQLYADWNEQKDPERAVALATRVMEQVRDGVLDPVPRIELLEMAAEPLWDGPGGSPELVLEAVRAAQSAFRAAEEHGGLRTVERLRVRGRPWVLYGRSQFRVGHNREAFVTALAALTWLEDFVDGASFLEDIIGRPDYNPVAELAVAILGIYPAALRRANLKELRGQYIGHAIKLVRAYVDRDHPPVLYPRTGALAAQWLYLLAEEAGMEYFQLVGLLYQLDCRARPAHERGQLTTSLRDAAFAGYSGDEAGAVKHTEEATIMLASGILPRHERVVQAHVYLAA